jgi:hypothetical protein
MSSFDTARLNPLATLASGRICVVEVGHDLDAATAGRADWSRARACYRIQLHPNLIDGHWQAWQAVLRDVFFHECGHLALDHVADGAALESGLYLPRNLRLPAAIQAEREMLADSVGQTLSQWWQHCDVRAIAEGYERFDPTRLPEPLNSVVKAVLEYQKAKEAEKVAARAWAEKQLQRAAALPRGVYAFKTYAAHIASSAFA